MTGLILFKACHRIRKQEKLEDSFKNRHVIHQHHYQSQVSIPKPDFSTPPESLQYQGYVAGPIVAHYDNYSHQNLYPVIQHPQTYIYNPASIYPPLNN